MNRPHPADSRFAEAYGRAWTSDPAALLDFFAPDGSYTDVAMDTTYSGQEAIGRFHRWMLKFAPDSLIEFVEPCQSEGRVYLEWVWSGSFQGTLRLPDGTALSATGEKFSVPGVASCRFRADGRLLSHRDFWDLSTVVRQVSTMAPCNSSSS